MKQFWNWKKILILSLAAALVLTGGLFAWRGWPGRPGEAIPSAGLEYPRPAPIRFEPHDPDPTPVENYGPDPADFLVDEATGVEFVRGIAVVMFERGATGEQRQAALETSGGEIVGRADMVGKWQLRVPAGDYAALLDLCAALEALPGVAAAMPDLVARPVMQALPSADPWTGGAYSDAAGNSQWAEIDRLPEAWAVYGSTGGRAQLGIVDGGVNAGHEELTGIVQNITAVTAVSGPGYSYTVTPHWHGTGVAGVMAARANNGRGGAGVAWQADVYAVDCESARIAVPTTEVYYDCFLTALGRGAKAVNFSLGMIGSTGSYDPEAHGRTAARYLWQMLDWGYDCVFVQSAGNSRVDSQLNGFFASVTAGNAAQAGLTPQQTEMVLARILVAGALERNGAGYRQTASSAYGGVNQIYAPGVNVFTPNSGHSSAYQRISGTSLSAPQITATAGWMFALNPGLDGGQVGALLKHNAVSPPVVRDFSAASPATYRMLDCMRALEAALTPRLESIRPEVTVSEAGRTIILPDKTAASDLAAALQVVNGTLIYDKAQSSPERLAGTGDQVKARVAGSSGLEVTYTLVVKGDLNGDGRVDALDAQCLLGRTQSTWQPDYPEEIYELALDGMSAQALFDRGME